MKVQKDTASYLYSLSTCISHYLLPLMKKFLLYPFFFNYSIKRPNKNGLK